MALKAGYYGIKKFIADKLNRMNPGDSFATDAEIAAAMQNVTDTLRDAEVIEGKNLLNPTVASSGIVTRNADNTFTVNGTLSEAIVYELGRDCLPTLSNGDYMLSGRPKSGVPTETTLSIRKTNTATGTKGDYGDGVIWSVTDAETASAFCYIYLPAGTYDNVVFKPMLEKGTTVTTYEPYYVPLKDVVPTKADITALATKADITALGTQEGATASRLYHPGEHFYKDGKFCTVIGNADVAAESTWTLNTNYVEGTVADSLVKQATFSGTTDSTGNLQISTDNTIKIISALSENRICMPFTSTLGTYVRICKPDDMTPIASTAINGTYWYID